MPLTLILTKTVFNQHGISHFLEKLCSYAPLSKPEASPVKDRFRIQALTLRSPQGCPQGLRPQMAGTLTVLQSQPVTSHTHREMRKDRANNQKPTQDSKILKDSTVPRLMEMVLDHFCNRIFTAENFQAASSPFLPYSITRQVTIEHPPIVRPFEGPMVTVVNRRASSLPSHTSFAY